MGANLVIEGAKALDNLLRQLPERVLKKVARAAVGTGATPIVQETRARLSADEQTGTLMRSIDKKVKTYKTSAVAIIGAKSGVTGEWHGKTRVPFRYFHLIEGGVAPHQQGHGEHPGFVGRHPLEDAVAARGQDAEKRMSARLAEGIESEALQLRGK